MLSQCGVDFSIFTNGLDDSFAIVLVVKAGKYFAKTVCSIALSTFTNTNVYTRTTKQNFKNAVTAKNGGMSPQTFLDLIGVSGGVVYNDAVIFSEKSISQASEITYTFAYDKDLCIGSIIELNLPLWNGTVSNINIVDGCGESTFTIADTATCQNNIYTDETTCVNSGSMWFKQVWGCRSQ